MAMQLFFVLAIQILLLIILFAMMLYLLSMIISDFFGVPFVPTSKRVVHNIFKNITLKKGKGAFYDLGCGDGRLVFYVAQKYGVKSVGVELNPLLHFFAQVKKKINGTVNAHFLRRDIFKVNVADAQIIYLFLFPEVVTQLAPKLLNECKKGTIIISHGFVVPQWDKRIIKIQKEKPFSTYYYKI